MDIKSLQKRALTAALLVGWISLSYWHSTSIPLIIFLAVAWIIAAVDERPRLALSPLFFALYPTLSFLALMALSLWYRPQIGYLLAVVCGHDTGAYFVGHAFGHHKLAHKISPGKTWEGFFGGIVTSYALALIWNWYMGWPLSKNEYLILTGMLSILGVVGDLFESYLKRRVGIKDSGSTLPGHGGVFDRLDSLITTAPFLLIYILYTSQT